LCLKPKWQFRWNQSPLFLYLSDGVLPPAPRPCFLFTRKLFWPFPPRRFKPLPASAGPVDGKPHGRHKVPPRFCFGYRFQEGALFRAPHQSPSRRGRGSLGSHPVQWACRVEPPQFGHLAPSPASSTDQRLRKILYSERAAGNVVQSWGINGAKHTKTTFKKKEKKNFKLAWP